MKKLFLFNALFVFGLVVYGQGIGIIDTTGKYKLGGTFISHSTLSHPFDTIPNITGWTNAKDAHRDEMVIVPMYDTVKILMLFCDTSNLIFNGRILVDTTGYAQIQFDVHSQYGYEVRKVVKKNNTDGVLDPYNTFGFKYEEWLVYYHELFLDENKKPLSKNIIVWQTRTL